MSGKLYIVGNGFDLHHGIPSSYRAFGEFLRDHDPRTFDFVERYFDVSADFWAEFEERLASFDTDTLVDDASQFLVGYGAEDWSDAYHHDYQYELDQVVEAISKTMRSRFGDWIRQLQIPDPSDITALRLRVDTSAAFLNFNYTPSLQRLYGVPNSHVLHIHGSASDINAQLVLGHGWKPPEALDPYRFEQEPEAADMRVVEGQRTIDNYFKDTFKPTELIIRDNRAFFESLANVEKVFVMGHSLSEVDHPYFHEVLRYTCASRVKWKVSYRGDLSGPRSRLEELDIDPTTVEFLSLIDF